MTGVSRVFSGMLTPSFNACQRLHTHGDVEKIKNKKTYKAHDVGMIEVAKQLKLLDVHCEEEVSYLPEDLY